MKIKITLIFIGTLIIFGCKKTKTVQKQGFTAINPLSYTDVVYIADKDEVIASTYDGSIYTLTKQGSKELLINIADEIYGMQYSKSRHKAYITTYRSGVLVIDLAKRAVIKKIEVGKGNWLVNLRLSDNERYLSGLGVRKNNYIWDLNADYHRIEILDQLPNHFIRHISDDGKAYFQTFDKYSIWDIEKGVVLEEIPVFGKIDDIDSKGNSVALYDNRFFFYDRDKKRILYEKKHPYLIFQEANGDTLHDPYQLKLLYSKIIKDKIYTVGLDKSIRVWRKSNGDLLDEWVAHKATISGFDVSRDKSQWVTVDLKGGVIFKDL
ncbi:YncE family protein [Spongiimicrobium salis]|uniref:YncE family protein n=1 Tax=Spongiimicrobium salis TaxID=1667022 RepID=UPI00374D2371